MHSWLIAILLFLVASGVVPPDAYADRGQIDGTLEWRYGAHDAEEDGDRVFESSWFTQQYSLIYRTKGDLARGRAGNYNLALGYEWTSLDGSMNGESTDVSTDKILYRGDVVIAPGGLPFHLRLYSHDLHRSTFTTGSASGLFESPGSEGLGAQNTVVGIYNGQQLASGFTLMVGSASGNYEGMYRNVLANAPRLLIDYRQYDVRDLQGVSPQHYRDRNLAFVSLNKKDNWFHYRVFDHKDFINANNDFVEKAYILGTIDHAMQRRWVQLTNWVKFSTDASYTTTSQLSRGQETDRRYEINLFSVARRSDWEASNFTTFRRETDGMSLQRDLVFPVYITKALDPETTLRTRFIAEREDRSLFADSEDRLLFGEDEEDIRDSTREVVFLSNRLEALQRQPWTLTGQIDAEHKSGDYGEGVSMRALAEAGTNHLYRPRFDMFGAYSVGYFGGEGIDGGNVGFWEQTLTGRLETDLNMRFRTGVTQEFLYGSGTLDRQVGYYILPKSDLGLVLSGVGVERRDGSVLRSTTTWFGEYRGSARLSSRLELTYDYLSDDQSTEDVFIASHRLRYDRRKFYTTLQNRLVLGNHRVTSGGSGAGSVLNAGSLSEAEQTFENRLFLAVYPMRAMEASLRVDHDWRRSREGDSQQYLVEQNLRYHVRSAASRRTLATLGQEFLFERLESPRAEVRSARTLTLTGELYPTIRTLLGMRLRYLYLEPEDTTTYTAYLTAGINWEKLQLAVDYSYGTRDGGDDPERKEHRWEMKARKIF